MWTNCNVRCYTIDHVNTYGKNELEGKRRGVARAGHANEKKGKNKKARDVDLDRMS